MHLFNKVLNLFNVNLTSLVVEKVAAFLARQHLRLAPPINYERILEIYERFQAINIKNERLRKMVFICQEFYFSLKKSIEKKI